MLKRSPRFLRAVVAHGKWDACDQLDDVPHPSEQPVAYEIVGKPGMCHLNRRGGGGGFYPIATYRLVRAQPGEAEMRGTEAWQAWCHKNA
jgi:hypothetical protein